MKFWQQILIILAGISLIVLFTSLKNRPSPMPEPPPTPSPLPASTQQPQTYSNPPEMALEENTTYFAALETSKGPMTIKLFADQTPVTVNNFIFLAREGFYDNTPFHRIIKGFMIQGGDPTGTGTGNPGYQFADEPITQNYDRGIIAMANSGPNTNGSQFFIMHQNSPNLPKNYVIFGKLIKGFDTLDAIANTKVKANQSGELSQPQEPVTLQKVTITQLPKGDEQ